MSNHRPFNRLNSLLMAAQALMAQSGCTLQFALSQYPSYRSRGKGMEKTIKARRSKHMDSVRAARKAKNIIKRRAK